MNLTGRDGWKQIIKYRNLNWNDLSFDIYLYNIPWNAKALSIHFHYNWSDHTAIGIVSRRAGWGFAVTLNFVCRAFFSSFCWLHVHWLILFTSLIWASTCFQPRIGSAIRTRHAVVLFFFARSNDEYLAN